jgi:hypothetical protein
VGCYHDLFWHRSTPLRTSPRNARNITAHHAVSTKAAQLRTAPSSTKGASQDVIIQDAEEGTKGGKKRCKQRRQEAATNDNSDINK